jgi:hypothetical protein
MVKDSNGYAADHAAQLAQVEFLGNIGGKGFEKDPF